MKTAVCISNIGKIDEVTPLCKQSVDYDLFYWTENTLPFPLPNFDNRMKGKYLKTQSHRFLDHDIIIHLDASIEVINKDFVKNCIEELKGSDLLIEKHAQRKNVYEELEYIIDKMKQGDKYLLRRYAKQPLYLEYQYYKDQKLPKDFPLFQCSFFVRWNNFKLNQMFDDWFDHIHRFSNFDQSQFAYAAWKHEAMIKTVETKDLFIRNKHLNYNL